MRKKLLALALILLAFAFFNNSNLFSSGRQGRPLLVAHRGLAQTFSTEGLTSETNTAERIYPPAHPYLENTIPSMGAAFACGADVVELDIHPTTDGQFAVFHDWTLDYRTDGSGVTREHSMAELKTLDVGYGYTADGGQTYPFRGKGIGMMPTLPEVLEQFPDREFLIHIKSNDPAEGEMLADYLLSLPEERRGQISVYGGDKPIDRLQARIPGMQTMSNDNAIKALLQYMAVGWTGYVPESCRDALFIIPDAYAPWLWGWPGRFLNRMDEANTRVVVAAWNGQVSSGFSSLASLERLPENYSGGIWIDRIDIIGPYYKPGLKGEINP